MLWEVAMMCFFGFLQVGEIVSPQGGFDAACHLAQGDVRVYDLDLLVTCAVRFNPQRMYSSCTIELMLGSPRPSAIWE